MSFDKLIEAIDIEANLFLRNLDHAICITDDLVDHKVNSIRGADVLLHMNVVTEIAIKRPSLFDAIRKNYDALLVAGLADISFIPLKKDNEDELKIWVKRGYRMSIAFDVLCFLDKTFETEENRSWIFASQTKALVLNDCADILSGEFEDFYQVRRNYIALKHFSQEIYFNWKNEKQKLFEVASRVMEEIEFDQPKDVRLMEVYEELRGKNGWILLVGNKN